jgi:outer membrane protein insertion porin family
MPCSYRIDFRASVRLCAFSLVLVLSPFLAAPLAIAQQNATQAAAPQQSGSSPLAAVEVVGSKRYRSEQIAPFAGLHLGSGISRDDLQQGANRLAALGIFMGVQYRFASSGTGVKVTYEVVDAPEIPVTFDNIPWLTDEELTAGLKTALPLFDGNAPESGAFLDDISSAIQKLLDAKSIHARVTHNLTIAGAANQKVQLFSAEGADLIVGAIEFPDALARTDHGLQDRVIDLIGQPYSRSGLEVFELEQVRPIYISHGFLQVKFGQPDVKFTSTPNTPAADTSKVTITIPIEPGHPYNWNGITFKGNYSIPTETFDELVKLQTGDVADGMKIESGIEAARNFYSERGYLDAKIEAVPKFDEDSKRVAYAVTIDEGPQYHMGQLILTGLSLDGEKRIRSAWQIPAGAIFDKNAYETFVDTGIRRAFAGSPFRYDKIGSFVQQNPQDAKVDVLLDFQ